MCPCAAPATVLDRANVQVASVPNNDSGGPVLPGAHYRIATPHGSLPTAMSAIRVAVAVSMTETVPERPQAT